MGEKPRENIVIDESRIGVFGEIDNGRLKDILKGLQNDTFNNFVKVNSIPINLEDGTTSPFDFPIFNKTDFEKKNLKSNRYYVFSRVGFSDDGKQAVVIFVDVCEPLCTKGNYFLLVNKNGNWQVVEESDSWKS